MCRCGFSCWYYLANESLCLHTFLEAFHAKSNINNDKAEVSFKHILCVQGLWHMHALHSIHPLFVAACYMHFILQCPGVPHVFKNQSNAPGALSFVLLLAGLALFTKYAKGLAESGKTQKEGHTTSPRTSRFTWSLTEGPGAAQWYSDKSGGVERWGCKAFRHKNSTKIYSFRILLKVSKQTTVTKWIFCLCYFTLMIPKI